MGHHGRHELEDGVDDRMSVESGRPLMVDRRPLHELKGEVNDRTTVEYGRSLKIDRHPHHKLEQVNEIAE